MNRDFPLAPTPEPNQDKGKGKKQQSKVNTYLQDRELMRKVDDSIPFAKTDQEVLRLRSKSDSLWKEQLRKSPK